MSLFDHPLPLKHEWLKAWNGVVAGMPDARTHPSLPGPLCSHHQHPSPSPSPSFVLHALLPMTAFACLTLFLDGYEARQTASAVESNNPAASNQEPSHDGMDAANDPRAMERVPVSMEAGPSRCHMESSFLNILHSTGFAEWAARAEAQNQQLGVAPTWPTEREVGTSSSSDGKSRKSSASSRSSNKSSSAKKGSRPRKAKDGEGKGKSQASRSKRTEESVEEDEEMDAEAYERENFVPHYANYNNMDAELNILKRHLMQRGGFS
ncbi:hypothetical protein JDV02_008968 [Purpureocillium takamizusanense]|uniref:Uncharacterized protein n=1 Tax=Purpureocillium takamizusanense TaxID=2060973 RepID=A0A9Q8QNZ5_9HYPO|nr:uncharacterized protein JDV02_008968 [Purpureocillium takamizusanense]UNI23130.1 hypothetical protein JDV02_008968 [Purpureocillium takamizusanense]